MLNSVQKSLVKPLEPSSCAAAFDGPKTLILAAARSSARPATSGASGPTTTKADVRVATEGHHGGMVGNIEGDAFGDLGDAGVAGRAVELGQAAGWPKWPRPARARGRRNR